jgi:hypothetical protein
MREKRVRFMKMVKRKSARERTKRNEKPQGEEWVNRERERGRQQADCIRTNQKVKLQTKNHKKPHLV